jgi:hypothetical protein
MARENAAEVSALKLKVFELEMQDAQVMHCIYCALYILYTMHYALCTILYTMHYTIHYILHNTSRLIHLF